MNDREPECECPGPGFCQRYQISQTEYAWLVCRGVGTEDRPCTDQKSQSYKRKWRLNLLEKSGAGPGLLRKAKNAAKAAVKHAADRFRLAPAEVLDLREGICSACSFNKGDRCTHPNCGCPLKGKLSRGGVRPSKLELASESCPMGYWSAV